MIMNVTDVEKSNINIDKIYIVDLNVGYDIINACFELHSIKNV